MKLETMDTDMKYIRDKIYHGRQAATLPPAYTKATESAMIQSYYKNLTPEQVSSLTELFIDDFKMYGYDTDLASVLHWKK